MFKNYLTVAIRNLLRHKIHSFISISGLAAKVLTDEVVEIPFVSGSILKIEAVNGQISVRQKDGESVRVTAKIRASANERLDLLDIEVKYDEENSLIVGAKWPDRMDDEGVGFEIEIPAVSGIEARTQNGGIKVTGLSGSAKLRSTNGPIKILNHKGPVTAETSNDNVVVAHVTGDLLAKTTNDRIAISDYQGTVFAQTSSGPISLARSKGAAELRTTDDRIEIKNHHGSVIALTSNDKVIISDVTGAVKARTTNDNIEISSAHNSVDAETSNSRISISLSDNAPGPVKARTRNGIVFLSVGRDFVGELRLDAGDEVVFENVPASMGIDRTNAGVVLNFGNGAESSVATNENIYFKIE